MTENRVLRRIFGVMRKKVTESLRTWHREELHHMYSLSTITGILKWTVGGAGHVAWMVQLRNAYTIFVTKFCREGRDLLENLGVNWRIVCKMDLKNRGWITADWILLPRCRFQCLTVLNSVMNSPHVCTWSTNH